MNPSAVHQVVGLSSDLCSDCPAESSVSESSRPLSSESPLCPTSPSGATATQEIVSATSSTVVPRSSVTTSGAVVTTPYSVCESRVTESLSTTIASTVCGRPDYVTNFSVDSVNIIT